MQQRMLFLVPLVLFCATAAHAEDDQPKCNPDGTQMEMNACAYDDLQKADDALNAMYKKALAFAKDQDDNYKDQPDLQGAVKALKKAQRAWIDYRDGQCEGVGFEARGGSLEPMLVASCEADLTNKRTAELKELMQSPEGDGK